MSLKMKLEQNQIHDPQITKAIFELKKVIDSLLRDNNNDVIALELKAITDQLSGIKKEVTIGELFCPQEGACEIPVPK